MCCGYYLIQFRVTPPDDPIQPDRDSAPARPLPHTATTQSQQTEAPWRPNRSSR
uniref:Uncharacterized protein n=1 Tax=Siphoviridae sp. ctnLs3 TaxID=2827937 RepID=A0A8S5TD12_9CAUD|nr:MAG TPA: hypothetical protein [Siphoviridae sp. ctnLs3]